MREYLFRGKDKKTGKWVFGYYRVGAYWKNHMIDSAHGPQSDEVIPETVGQFTGLHDKNGVKIFALDIVLYKGIKCLVRWDDEKAGFFIGEDKYWMMNDTEIEVIGNVFDDPELLEGNNA